MSYCMVIDLKKCVGCHGCTTACKGAHGTPRGVSRSQVRFEVEGTYPDVRKHHLPMLCMQCSKPACVEVCPVSATWKEDDGIVVIDKTLCIGCGLCAEACPYEARHTVKSADGYFGAELTEYEQIAAAGMPKDTTDKCNWCRERMNAGGKQACVEACTAGARIFGEYEELKELIESRNGYQLMSDAGTEPNVWYLPDFVNE